MYFINKCNIMLSFLSDMKCNYVFRIKLTILQSVSGIFLYVFSNSVVYCGSCAHNISQIL